MRSPPSPRLQWIAATLARSLVLVVASFPLPAHADPQVSTSERDAVALRFASDPAAQTLALSLFDADGDVVDTLPAERMDGGYRGMIQLVPALPVGADRKHLAWVAGALHDFDEFFAALETAREGSAGARSGASAIRYRWRGLGVHFFRSVGKTTPNAFASDWTVAYNIRGSIDTSADAARETLFHEIFHLDDEDHGEWSLAHLSEIRDAIERRCGARTACLTPYAPTSTIVRRGTYYAFQPGNDVREYGAELALRWYREQRAVVRGEHLAERPFKCGPDENRRAWDAISAEFFGGIDLVPPC